MIWLWDVVWGVGVDGNDQQIHVWAGAMPTKTIFDIVKDIDIQLLLVISAIFVSVCLPGKEILLVEAWGTLSCG